MCSSICYRPPVHSTAFWQSTVLQGRCWAFFISENRGVSSKFSHSLNLSLLISGSSQLSEGSVYTETTGRCFHTDPGRSTRVAAGTCSGLSWEQLLERNWYVRQCISLGRFLFNLAPPQAHKKYTDELLQLKILKFILPCTQNNGLILYQPGIAFCCK